VDLLVGFCTRFYVGPFQEKTQIFLCYNEVEIFRTDFQINQKFFKRLYIREKFLVTESCTATVEDSPISSKLPTLFGNSGTSVPQISLFSVFTFSAITATPFYYLRRQCLVSYWSRSGRFSCCSPVLFVMLWW
jgi:hypothetical protein